VRFVRLHHQAISMSDQAERLCERAKAGDREAASELVAQFYERIYGWFRRLSGHDADAADLTQKPSQSLAIVARVPGALQLFHCCTASDITFTSIGADSGGRQTRRRTGGMRAWQRVRALRPRGRARRGLPPLRIGGTTAEETRQTITCITTRACRSPKPPRHSVSRPARSNIACEQALDFLRTRLAD
jgi:hypothetical protein